MASHRGLFAQFEPGFWLNDPRVRDLSPSDRSRYADLWVMTVLQRCEVIRSWRQACRRLWASTYRAVDLIAARLASPSPGRDPLIEILSPELLRVCGSAKVHKRASRGDPVVRADVDVDVDVDEDKDKDVDVEARGAGLEPRATQPKPRDTDTKPTDHASQGRSTPDTAPAPAKTHRTPEEAQAELDKVRGSESYKKLRATLDACPTTPVDDGRPKSLMKQQAEAKALQDARDAAQPRPKTPRQKRREADPPGVGEVLAKGI